MNTVYSTRLEKEKISRLVLELEKTEHGFKHIIKAGNEILADPAVIHFTVAKELFANESYQARMLATFLLGELSKRHTRALQFLITKVAADNNWRVQEMLAKAIDSYCAEKGYENSLPDITRWLGGSDANVKRGVIEGLRVWTSRPYFKNNPGIAITLISRHKSDDSEYLRKSVGNALRDIRKKFPQLVQVEIDSWDITDPRTAFTLKLVIKGKG